MEDTNTLQWTDLNQGMLEALDDLFFTGYYPDIREHVYELSGLADRATITPGAIIAHYLWVNSVSQRATKPSIKNENRMQALATIVRAHYRREEKIDAARLEIIVQAVVPVLARAVSEVNAEEIKELHEDIHGFDSSVNIERLQLEGRDFEEELEDRVNRELTFVSAAARERLIAELRESHEQNEVKPPSERTSNMMR